MAIRTIESHFERMSVNDENEPFNKGPVYTKPKVTDREAECNAGVSTDIVLGFFVNGKVAVRVGAKYSAELESKSSQFA